MVPWHTLKVSHLATAHYARGAERKRRRLDEEELRESMDMAFQAYGEPLENVTTFRYMRQVMKAGDDEWPSVLGNLQKARKS